MSLIHPAESAPEKLRTSAGDVISDDDERRWVYPRSAGLLGLQDQEAPNAADLFSGWRLIFEWMSEQHPLILVFEDLQRGLARLHRVPARLVARLCAVHADAEPRRAARPSTTSAPPWRAGSARTEESRG